MRIVTNVIAQHADEAATLWLLRRSAVDAPDYSLHDLARLDGRLEAHIDGLRIAGDDGWSTCAEQLAIKEEGEVFAAGVLAFESGNSDRIAQVFRTAEQAANTVDALASALGWLTLEQAGQHISRCLQSPVSIHKKVGLATLAIHRQNRGDALRHALRDSDSGLQARAVKAVGELGLVDLAEQVTRAISSENPNVQFWASWSTALLTGSSVALSSLQRLAETAHARRVEAVQMVARRSAHSEAMAWHKKLANRPEHLRLAISSAGHLGDPEKIPWLIDRMKQLPLARLAGEAFTMITGVDLAYQDLERKPPEDFDAGPTEDPKDENVDLDPDEDLPWPEPMLVQRWWDKHRSEFQNGTRYLLGKPLTPDWLKLVLRDGRQRHRAAAALELAIRQPGTPLFNVKAPGFRQIEILGKPGPVIR